MPSLIISSPNEERTMPELMGCFPGPQSLSWFRRSTRDLGDSQANMVILLLFLWIQQ